MPSKIIKCVVVGDGAVGKTCMLMRYADKEFPSQYVPTVFDNYITNVDVANETYCLELFDTAGQEAYERVRALSYANTDIFIVCFSVVSFTSFDNVKTTWVPDIRHFNPKNKFILVGTMTDLRLNHELVGKLVVTTGRKPITTEQGAALAKKLGALSYVECSALTKEGLKDVFDEAIMAVLNVAKEEGGAKKIIKKCALL